MTWQLRRATATDLTAIMHLETTLFVTDAWSADMMLRDVTDPDCYYLVAFAPDHPGHIDGYAGLLAPTGAVESDIQTIAVSETARGRGLGRTLMLSLISEARKRGARDVFLEVRADNPGAQRLYLSLGFEQVGVRTGYYQPDNVDALVMRLRIPRPSMSMASEPAATTAAPEETL
ncbi:MAG: ribosomal protein S18-alanine N-acetyltransferase [Cryobacterium sp.]